MPVTTWAEMRLGSKAGALDPVGRGQGEGGRAHRDQDVGAEAGGVLPDLALEPDDPGRARRPRLIRMTTSQMLIPPY